MPSVVIAAGGTAGHVVPALAIADELRDKGVTVSFLGARGKLEAELVPKAGYEVDLLDLSGIDRKNPLKAARAALQAAAAIPKARKLIKSRGADAVVGGGGFVAGPAGVAARRLKLPLVLTEADRHLGLANRLLARRADRVCLAFEIEGIDGANVKLTGRPVGRAVLNADRVRARARFGIDAEASCLLVMGGSQGARTINFASIEALAERPGRDFDVIHVSGSRDHAALAERLSAAEHADRYTLLEYEPDMGDGIAASDLALARSGASVFELAALGRAAVLVPYPYATGDHQSANAEWMASAGAAVVVPDSELDADRLLAEVGEILGDPARLGEMSAASKSLARPNAAADVADEVMKLIGAAA
ncbi:MAG: undecaprenyldiphospho-muramoylpentapeptide beta-N-acetylglucosaminyltransferase [Solirubrobacterales bacterium]|nr:undecaprenyldiphospho-muramoylpentapeptide beta-N-acetylglucosaminyltransferase [Solirubrobacterales bacterium]OJU95249.1 MAG: undecaprenyldiphospho-muramoylpentapeptide beta-N-acetylglucosaminyltransferase [Solirubrobacterales bacterium 67-14]